MASSTSITGGRHSVFESFPTPSRFEEFRRRYIEELRSQRPRLTELRRRARNGTLTLVYSARDTEHNDAVVLAEILRRGLPKAGTRA